MAEKKVSETAEKKTTVKKTSTTTKKAATSTTKKTTASTAKKTVEKVEKVEKKETAKKVVEENAVRLKDKYLKEVVPLLMQEYSYTSIMQVPKIDKVVLNIGVGDAAKNSKLLEESVKELTIISGQKPVVTKAKKSIATFKLREGMPIGCKVTLRGDRMYQFIDKLFTISLPRVRDFHGVSKNAFDGRGNYTLGVKEQLIFPEIKYDEVNVSRGMDVVFVTTAQSDKEAMSLLRALGMPFTK